MEKVSTTPEKKIGLFAKISAGFKVAAEGIASANRIGDLCIVKIRSLLQKVNFDDVRNIVEKYKAKQEAKVKTLRGDEKKKLANKIKTIDSAVEYIDVLENFAQGGELEAPTDAVLDVIKEMADEKENKTLAIVVQVIQVSLKAIKGIQSLQQKSEDTEDACEESTAKADETPALSNAQIALQSMISMAVQDGVVSDEEKAILLAQAAEAGVEEAELDNMIAEALK